MMTKKPPDINDKDAELLKLLEAGVKKVLKSKEAKPGERLQAVQAGCKLLAIRHKLGTDDDANFFSK